VTHVFARRLGLALLAAVAVTVAVTARATAEQAGNRAAAAADADHEARAAGRATVVALTAAEPVGRSVRPGTATGVQALPLAWADGAGTFVTGTGKACALLTTTGPATVAVEGAGYDPVEAAWPAGGWHVWCWTGLRSGTAYQLRLTPAASGVGVEGVLTDH